MGTEEVRSRSYLFMFFIDKCRVSGKFPISHHEETVAVSF